MTSRAGPVKRKTRREPLGKIRCGHGPLPVGGAQIKGSWYLCPCTRYLNHRGRGSESKLPNSPNPRSPFGAGKRRATEISVLPGWIRKLSPPLSFALGLPPIIARQTWR